LTQARGIFVTGTDTGVGKTVVAAGLVTAFRQRGINVGVMKPISTGGVRRRELLLSADAEFLAHVADAPESMRVISPVVLVEPLAPAVAARRANVEIDLDEVRRSFAQIVAAHDAVVVEGIGGLLVPIARKYYVADLAAEMGLPLVVVARPGLGTINHTLLTVEVARARGLTVAGIIINGYNAETAGVAEETNPGEIEKETGLPVLTIVPHDPETDPRRPHLGRAVIEACQAIDFRKLLR